MLEPRFGGEQEDAQHPFRPGDSQPLWEIAPTGNPEKMRALDTEVALQFEEVLHEALARQRQMSGWHHLARHYRHDLPRGLYLSVAGSSALVVASLQCYKTGRQQ